MKVSGRAKLAGVIGWPVAHSLSPVLHQHWLEENGIDGAYVPIPSRREDFSVVIDGLRRAGFAGVNVTVPHKEAAFALCHVLDEAAKTAGAVNLLLFRPDGRYEGLNTDASGLAESLSEKLGMEFLRARTVLVLGAGGAARGAVLALNSLGAARILIVNRSAERGEELRARLTGAVAAKLETQPWADRRQAAAQAFLLVNTTSAGMRGQAALDFCVDDLPKDAAVCDIVYNPLETPLLSDARRRGLKTIDGLGMLIYQAVPAFAAFYGKNPRVTGPLRLKLEEALADGR